MDRKIRVLHVLSGMDRAGTENLLMSLYRNINRDKIQFDFAVSAERKCAFDDEIIDLGGKIYHYPRYRGYNHLSYIKWWNDFFSQHNEHYIIHGHIGSTAAIYLSIAKKYGRFAVAHSHNTNPKLSITSVLYRVYSYRTRFIADYFFGCSKQALIDRYGKKIANDEQKSSVLNNAIDTEKFVFDPQIREQIRNELHINTDEVIIGTVGRLSQQKNPYIIIEIVNELKKRGKTFRFLWTGTGELENEIKKKIHSLNIDNLFIFTGVRSDINRILMGMDIFIFPSLWEGLGISYVEAQASGLPALCSNAVSLDGKVSDNVKYLPLNDIEEWCNEINYQISVIKPNLGQRSLAYLQVINAGFDIKDTTRRIEQFYFDKLIK